MYVRGAPPRAFGVASAVSRAAHPAALVRERRLVELRKTLTPPRRDGAVDID